MKASVRNVSIAPKKANLVAHLIRGKSVPEAIDILRFTPKKAAKILLKALKSAVANAENNFKQKAENLYVREVKVSKGFTLRRFIPVSRGRAHPIGKTASHIHIFLDAKNSETTKPKAAPAKTEEKTEKKETPKAKTTTKTTKKS